VRIAALLIVFALVGCDRKVAGGSTDGKEVFAAACARCHGEAGRPSAQMASQLGVVDLTSAEFRARRSAAAVEHQIRRGSANGRMPAFTGALAEPQIAAVTAYVMALGQ
jgi:mono/diheme cytochrome c family protein